MKNQCYDCQYKRSIPGDCHIKCINPDPTIVGNKHGIAHGWFWYPLIFDPIWMDTECHNYKKEG